MQLETLAALNAERAARRAAILVTDVAAGTGNQRVLQIDPATGNRIVLTGTVVGSGPAVTVAAVASTGATAPPRP